MSILTPQLHLRDTHSLSRDVFSLLILHTTTQTNIVMSLETPTVNTQPIQETVTILHKLLPSIFNSHCFNDKDLPFSQEVKQTEIGHLFEHILLEYICDVKIIHGSQKPVHNGITSWDWNKDKKGTFHIIVDVGKNDKHIFRQALRMSISLLEEILEYDPSRKRRKITPKPFSYQLH